MKRYFLAPSADMQALAAGVNSIGEYHYINLDSHGVAGVGFVVLVMMNDSKAPLPGWQELPHLLDAATTLAAVVAPATPGAKAPLALLADVGALATHTGYTLAKQLATIHPLFAP